MKNKQNCCRSLAHCIDSTSICRSFLFKCGLKSAGGRWNWNGNVNRKNKQTHGSKTPPLCLRVVFFVTRRRNISLNANFLIPRPHICHIGLQLNMQLFFFFLFHSTNSVMKQFCFFFCLENAALVSYLMGRKQRIAGKEQQGVFSGSTCFCPCRR